MSLKIGIVGLPNVGKSTLFNALTKSKGAVAQNYPFCTIDPNVGIVEVPDHRIAELAKVSNSEKVIPAVIEFVDIAGLVKGASEGQGLGNKFLSHIRECQAIAHVVRGFEDTNVIHVHGKIDPKTDKEVIESELILADLQTMEKRVSKAESDAKSGDRGKKEQLDLLIKIKKEMEAGTLAINIELNDKEKEAISDLHLITMKPHLYIINLTDKEISSFDKDEYAKKMDIKDPDKIIPICAKIEEDLYGFNDEEREEYLRTMGIPETGLNQLIKTAYKTLGLITYFTSGPKETRAWTIINGMLAPQAAGVIHTDFENGFVKAEVINWKDFVDCGGEVVAKEKGKLRIEGKEYVVKDGDTMHFRFTS
jgi:hypothetical protein